MKQLRSYLENPETHTNRILLSIPCKSFKRFIQTILCFFQRLFNCINSSTSRFFIPISRIIHHTYFFQYLYFSMVTPIKTLMGANTSALFLSLMRIIRHYLIPSSAIDPHKPVPLKLHHLIQFFLDPPLANSRIFAIR